MGLLRKHEISFSRLTLPDPNATIEKLWGTSSLNLYGVGNAGTVVHYSGNTWQKIESGTTTDIQDIWGGVDPTTGTTYALATVSTVYYGGVSELLRIRGIQLDTLSTNGLSWSIRGVWSDNENYYIVGDEVYSKNLLQNAMWRIIRVAPTNQYGYVESIRGNAQNDIIAAGDFGTLLHFNGSTWYNFTPQINMSNAVLYSVNIKGNLLVAVGWYGDRAIAVVGERK